MSVLRTAYVAVKPDLQNFGAELKAKLKAIDANKDAHRIGSGMGDGLTKGFNEKGNAFTKAAAGMAARMAIVGSSAAAAAPGVIQLTAALAPAAGALVALPAAMAAVKVASATFKIATAGVGEAITAGLTGTAKQAEKALKDLPPAAAGFARSIIALKPSIESLKASVAQRFFLPLQDEVKATANIYFPLLKKSMSDLAGPLGGLGEQFAQTARKADVIKAVKDIFLGTRLAVINLRGAIDPLTTAFAVLIQSTAPELPGIASGITRMAQGIARFITNAVDSGKVTAVFEAAKATFRDLGGIIMNVGSIIGSVFKASNLSGQGLLANFKQLTGQVAAFLKSAEGSSTLTSVFATLNQLGGAMRTSLAAVLPAVAQSLKAILPAIGNLAPAFAQIVVAIAPLLPALTAIVVKLINGMVPAIQSLAKWLTENQSVLKGFAVAIGVAYAAVKVYEVYTKAAAVVTTVWNVAQKAAAVASKVWAAGQWVLNAALSANPIGIVVVAVAALVAGIIIAYKNSETFRNIVNKAWGAVKTAIGAVASWFTGTILPSLKKAYDTIADAAMWLWKNAIQPAWNGIKAAIDVAVTVVKAILAGLKAYFENVIAPVVRFLYNNVFKPMFNAIGFVVKAAWVVIQIALAAMKLYFEKVIMPVVTFLWKNVFVPAFNGIKTAVSVAWTAIKATLNALKTFFETVIYPVIRFLLNNVIKPVFTAIGTTISGAWNNVIKPTFNAVKTAFQAVGTALKGVWDNTVKPMFKAFGDFLKNTVAPAFDKGVTAIKTAWEKVKEAAKKPVAFVVNSVINPLVNGINSAASFLGVKDQIPTIKGFASGGRIPGTPSFKDNMLAGGPGGPIAVASGEFITNTKSTMANLPLVQAINSKRGRVTAQDVIPYVDGFDAGGVVGAIGGFFKKAINGAKGVVQAFTDPGKALSDIANKLLGGLPGKDSSLGKMVTGAAKRVITNAASWVTSKLLPPAPPSGGQTYPWIIDQAQKIVPGIKAISTFRKNATTLSGNTSYHASGKAVDFPPSEALAKGWNNRFKKVTNELITPYQQYNLHNGQKHTYTGAVWNQHNFAGGNAHDHIAVAGNLGGGIPGGAVAGGSLGQWINAALQATGTSSSWASGLNTLIMRESGGNPRAQNNWDSNAAAGQASRGLMQTIPSTFAAYRLKSLPNDIFNPVANIAAGIRYIKSRYGDISNVQQANPNKPPKGYALGGLLSGKSGLMPFGSYDSGGYLPKGLSIAHNGTGRPEPVGHGLNDEQTDLLKQILGAVKDSGGDVAAALSGANRNTFTRARTMGARA